MQWCSSVFVPKNSGLSLVRYAQRRDALRFIVSSLIPVPMVRLRKERLGDGQNLQGIVLHPSGLREVVLVRRLHENARCECPVRAVQRVQSDARACSTLVNCTDHIGVGCGGVGDVGIGDVDVVSVGISDDVSVGIGVVGDAVENGTGVDAVAAACGVEEGCKVALLLPTGNRYSSK